MASKVHAVLIVPAAGDPYGLLQHGSGGARPPAAIRDPSTKPRWEGRWVLWHAGWGVPETYHTGHGFKLALVLAWDGKPVPEGLDRLARVWPTPPYPIPTARPCPEWLQYPDGLERIAKWLPGRPELCGMGTVVLLGAASCEVSDD